MKYNYLFCLDWQLFPSCGALSGSKVRVLVINVKLVGFRGQVADQFVLFGYLYQMGSLPVNFTLKYLFKQSWMVYCRFIIHGDSKRLQSFFFLLYI